MLLRYSETCQAAYRGLVQPDSEDKRVISATWAKDEDIHRFLRSLFLFADQMRIDSKSYELGLFRVGRLCKLFEPIGTLGLLMAKLMKTVQRKSNSEVRKKRRS